MSEKNIVVIFIGAMIGFALVSAILLGDLAFSGHDAPALSACKELHSMPVCMRSLYP